MGYEERTGARGLTRFDGLDLSVSEIEVALGESPDLDNVDLHPYGTLSSRQGYSVLSSLPDTALELFRARNDSGTVYYYAQCGGLIYRATSLSGTWTSTGQAISLTQRACFARARYEGASVVLVTDGERAPFMLTMATTVTSDPQPWPEGEYGDGSPGTGTPGYPAAWDGDWPTAFAVVNKGLGASAHRLEAWGFPSDPYRIDYSELGVTTNFLRSDVDDETATAQPALDGGYYYVGEGDQDVIVGVAVMFGYRVVFKLGRTYILPSDPGADDFGVTHVFDVGALSRRSIVQFGNDVAFWSATGPRLLSSVQDYGDLKQGNIGLKVQGIIEQVSESGRDEIVCINDLDNNRLMWFAPVGGGSTNNLVLIYYYDRPRWTKYSGAIAGMAGAMVVGREYGSGQNIYSVTYGGDVCEIGAAAGDDGADVEAYYYSAWMGFGELPDSARTLHLDLVIGDNGDNGLTIEHEEDLSGVLREVETPIRLIGGQGTRWGNFVWGEAAWGAPGRGYKKIGMPAVGNLMRLKFSSSGDSFELVGFRVEARQKGSRL